MSDCNLEILVFSRGESTWRKTSRSKGENQQQTLPTYTYIGNIGVDVVMWTLATWWEALALTSEPPLLPLHNLYLQAIIACDYSVSVTIYFGYNYYCYYYFKNNYHWYNSNNNNNYNNTTNNSNNNVITII